MRAFVSVCAAIIFGFTAAAAADSTNSDWFARTWQTEDGLPNNNVNSIAQTADGFLWVATPLGLTRFDGVTFDDISLTNFVNNSNRGVSALLTTPDGRLRLQMDRGAILDFNGRKAVALNLTNSPLDSAAQTMIEGDDGTLWISYLGGAICFLKEGKATIVSWQMGLPWAPNSSIAKDTQGRIWLARAGEVRMSNNKVFQRRARPGNPSIRLAAARNGGVWVFAGAQLFHLDEGAPMQKVGDLPAVNPDVEASAMIEDRHGGVWIGTTYNGLFRFDGSRIEKISVSHPEISSILEDNRGNIWVGTRGGGLNRLRPRTIHLETAQNGLPFESIQSVCEDTDGTLWAVTKNGFLARRDADRWQTISTNAGWPGGRATCVAADFRGGVWIGTRDFRLIHLRDGRFSAWDQADGLQVSPIASLMVARNGDVWIGGVSQTLQFYRDGKFTTVPLHENTHTVRSIVQDAAGQIWVGTSRGVLLQVNDTNAIDKTENADNATKSIRCLYADAEGGLWIGYAGFGLGRLKAGHFDRVTSVQGLFDDHISQIIPDGRGWFWFGTDRGIFKVRQSELLAAMANPNARVNSIHYGRGEGLPGLEANFEFGPKTLRSRDGRVWITTQNGLVIVNPETSENEFQPPPVFLKRVAVDGKNVAAYGGPVPLAGVMDLRKPSALPLPPNHREIRFEFTALDFSAPENIQLQYRLDGLDNGWIDANPQRIANYSRLPANDYRFRVRAGNEEGTWSEAGVAFAFTVTPFLWQRWWFQSLALVLFAVVMIFGARYVSFRRLRSRLRALEQQAALDKERARIARDLHDDLGGDLTEIVLLSDLMVDDPDKSGKTAQRVSDSVRQVIKRLDETVWAVNPRNDTLAHLVDYIAQFAVEFLRAAGIDCQVDLPSGVREETVPTEVRHHLFLVVKEALNNIVNHAQATEARLKITLNERDVCIVIEDNGHGFDHVPDNGCDDGLRNMRQRVEEIGGRFDLQSKVASGTRIVVTAPLNQ